MRQTKGRSRQKRYSSKEVRHFIKNHKDEKLRKEQEKQKQMKEAKRLADQRTAKNNFIYILYKLNVRFYPKQHSYMWAADAEL